MKTLTKEDLLKKARIYDNINNEGAEGYNPYRSEIEKREIEELKNAPRTKYDVLKDLEKCDCSLARECGTYDQAEIDKLNKEFENFENKEKEEFENTWTLEITKNRREKWNNLVKSGKLNDYEGKIDYEKKNIIEAKQSWNMNELKEAIKYHNL